jgi:hypothetical protein
MLKMMFAGYCLGYLRESDYERRESEGFYFKESDGRGFTRIPLADTLTKAQLALLETLPIVARSLVEWHGSL